MAIPKNIFQTFKTSKLPLITRFYTWRLRKQNPGWDYRFYDDENILLFFEKEYPPEYLNAYKSLTIGAAKADFFRYAALYKYGGVYLDIDGYAKIPLDKFILPDDEAVISHEGNPGFYCQWALIFNRQHPFLKRTLEKVLDNIQTHRYPRDVHQTTGPTAYTKAVNEMIAEDPGISYRILGVDFLGHLKPKYKLSKLSLYKNRSAHWRKEQATKDIIRPSDQ